MEFEFLWLVSIVRKIQFNRRMLLLRKLPACYTKRIWRFMTVIRESCATEFGNSILHFHIEHEIHFNRRTLLLQNYQHAKSGQ